MEAAIAWLVQTILATLLIDKLDAWIRQVGLADDVEKLKSEVERVEMVVGDLRGRAAGNRLLARLLVSLKDLLYDADDLTDELDYYRLQQQVQGVTADDPQAVPAAEQIDDTSRGNGDMLLDDTSSSRGVKKRKRRSKAWENFNVTEEDEEGNAVRATCKYCLTPIKCAAKDGTSGMRNHNKVCQKKPGGNDRLPNPSSAGDATETATPTLIADSSGRKRRREDEEAAQITAVADTYTPWDKAELSNRIQKLTSLLQNAREKVSEVLKLHGSDSASSSNHNPSTASDQRFRTSSLVPRQVYGRVAEKDSIKKLIKEDKSDGVRVLPIVGIAGVGKTALAQFVYNDPEVESQFDRRIWVWVSRNFDEVRLTREMLDFVSQERHKGISSFAKLQEILRSHANSKRLLIIFDDVWDDMKDCRWNKLLAPFIQGQGSRIVVLVTTRSLSVAKRLCTIKPVRLGALENDDFWLLFKSCAFCDGNHEGPRNRSTIGRKIAERLKGNPLAAVSIGALLREDLTVDHWSNILQKEDWKSLGLSEGIMPALKLSYDQLPYHLQLCFSCCSIFPDGYQFFGEQLVRIWISQGFVEANHSSKRLEEIGQLYLADLVNLGFFQQAEKEEEESSLGSQSSYSICGLMHDFARIVSRNYCATIDALQCTIILPTIQHLSVVTDSAYSTDRLGHIPRNSKFEEKLRNTVISVRKLRTLVLIGKYDSYFFQVFQDKFRTSHNLRLLQVSATSADFNSLVCSLVDPTHLRYVKHNSDGLDGDLPLVLTKFYHLQVLDLGSGNDHTVPDGMHNLVNLRHLVAEKGVYSSIANISSMTSLQELNDFKVHFRSSGFDISQLQSMNELVQLGVSELDNVKTRKEAYGAGLRNKEYLKKLHLSWKDKLSDSDEESTSDASSESSEEKDEEPSPMDDCGPSSEPSMDTVEKDYEHLSMDNYGLSSEQSLATVEKDDELLPMDDGGPSSESSIHTAEEVLEGLEPNMNLKHLQISRYDGTSSPTWLASKLSVTSLQTLQLDDCGGWRILPSLESLVFLTKLKLSSMRKVTEVLVPSLEELVLVQMPKLVRCSSTSVEDLSSSLRALQIENCLVLKVFDLFENDDEFGIEQRSWLPGLRKLILRDCPSLKVLNPLPPSTICSDLLIDRVSTLPYMEGSSSEKLRIGHSDELSVLDDTVLAFHNLRNCKSMRIVRCQSSFSLKGFSHLVSLKILELRRCPKLFSSDVMADGTHEDVTAANCKAFPSLETLQIISCGIAGNWLTLLLRHAPDLEELHLEKILSSPGEQDDVLTGLAGDEVVHVHVHVPLHLISSLKKITIQDCPSLICSWSREGFSGFTSLQELHIGERSKLFSSLVRDEDPANGILLLPASLEEFEISKNYFQKTLQPCFPSDLTSLKRLGVWGNLGLKSLDLRSCTALEELTIKACGSLTALEGLQSLGSLRHLKVSHCPGLSPCLESFSRQVYELLPRLETLEIDDPSVLTTSFCNHLTSA